MKSQAWEVLKEKGLGDGGKPEWEKKEWRPEWLMAKVVRGSTIWEVDEYITGGQIKSHAFVKFVIVFPLKLIGSPW